MVANHHMILARRAMTKQWQHGWWAGDSGRLDQSIRPVVSYLFIFCQLTILVILKTTNTEHIQIQIFSVKTWFDGQAE
jgi:hypothetical protein